MARIYKHTHKLHFSSPQPTPFSRDAHGNQGRWGWTCQPLDTDSYIRFQHAPRTHARTRESTMATQRTGGVCRYHPNPKPSSTRIQYRVYTNMRIKGPIGPAMAKTLLRMYIPIETSTVATTDVFIVRWMGEITEVPVIYDTVTDTLYSQALWLFIHAEDAYRAGASRIDFIFNPYSDNIIFHIPRSHTRAITYYGRKTHICTSYNPHYAVIKQKLDARRKREIYEAAFDTSSPNTVFDWYNGDATDAALVNYFGPATREAVQSQTEIDNNPETNPQIADTRSPPPASAETIDQSPDDPIDQTPEDHLRRTPNVARWSCKPIFASRNQNHSRNMVTGPHKRNARSGKWQLAPLYKQHPKSTYVPARPCILTLRR